MTISESTADWFQELGWVAKGEEIGMSNLLGIIIWIMRGDLGIWGFLK